MEVRVLRYFLAVASEEDNLWRIRIITYISTNPLKATNGS